MVDPDAEGRGVGRALCEHVLATAARNGYRAMQFNAVVETNLGAVHLWKSLGFGILTTIPAAFVHPVNGEVGLHVMHRALA
jgi:ribosomal protein S18 acetylase RimI-like enzyme